MTRQLKRMCDLRIGSVTFPDGETVICEKDSDFADAMARKAKTIPMIRRLLDIGKEIRSAS